ncbi:MAG: histidinol dehydrogenase [Verrucomicrobiota bacterium JB022]|nr:histidinol dehydrogenase [Verrucomicrobiota bacterium JB022]
MQRLEFNQPDFEQQLADFCAVNETPRSIADAVSGILSEVKAGGNAALCRSTERYDGVTLTPAQLRVPRDQMRAAADALDDETRAAIEEAIANVRDFHEKGLPQDWSGQNRHGATVGERFYPIERVGLYIPGGQVPLVSTVVMTATLAKLAGCPSIVACTPPGKDGKVNPGLLAAFALCGVEEVYSVGGAQAIAAMAYGTETIQPVCKIYGPGNAYVNEAKRQVLGTVGIDILAGPSEVMIITDRSAHPAYVAADLLAQAEHGSGREKLFLTVPDELTLDRILDELARQEPMLKRLERLRPVLDEGFLAIVTPSLAAAVQVANYVAPEHLELQVADEEIDFLCRDITTAGAIFCGHETPTVLGDFAAGPNHTLPTLRSGRFFSGLQITDFLRRSSITHYRRDSLKKAQHVVRAFSRLEQLDAHGESLEVRLREE